MTFGWLAMSQDTCAVLTAIFPLVLLTVVLERRAIHIKIRRRQWFRQAVLATISASAVGLLLTVIGVQTGGLISVLGLFAWIAFGVAVGGLVFSLLALMATVELEEDEPQAI